MSATITTAIVPNSLPIIQLTIHTPSASVTSYPLSIDSAHAQLSELGIDQIEYDELTDTRLLHDTTELLAA